jgi:tRNA modification GTPase
MNDVYKSNDTIFALSSGNVVCAVHLIRISGCNAEFLTRFLRHPKNGQLVLKLEPRKSCYLYFGFEDVQNDEKKFRLLDDVVVTYFPAPNSYTGEAVFEICSHGNPLICKSLFDSLRSLGFREALPGEFTQRAWMNGKISLLQAESLAQILSAETQDALEIARDTPVLSEHLSGLRNGLIECSAYLEAHIDFGPEDVGTFESFTILPQLNKIKISLNQLVDSFSVSRLVRMGTRVAFLGKPNAGKSTLFNALLKDNRAIVTNIAGTTRDVLEEKFEVQGKLFVLQDTAGLRKTSDTIEQIGIERAIKAAKNADIILFVIDSSVDTQVSEVIFEIKNHEIDMDKVVFVFHKADLVSKHMKLIEDLKLTIDNFSILNTREHDIIELENYLVNYSNLAQQEFKARKHPLLFSDRQKYLVENALKSLVQAEKLCQLNAYPEMIASEILNVMGNLREIFGTISLDDVYDNIFSRFCIGK